MSAISLPQFHLVQKMLRSRVRHCDIARATGLSVWTISRIASDPKFQTDEPASAGGHAGRRLSLAATVDLLFRAACDFVEDDLPEDDAPPDYIAANLRRCPGCGGMVYQWPCLTCQLRAPLAGTKPGPGEAPRDAGTQHGTCLRPPAQVLST
jgi:hypothetical protein